MLYIVYSMYIVICILDIVIRIVYLVYSGSRCTALDLVTRILFYEKPILKFRLYHENKLNSLVSNRSTGSMGQLQVKFAPYLISYIILVHLVATFEYMYIFYSDSFSSAVIVYVLK